MPVGYDHIHRNCAPLQGRWDGGAVRNHSLKRWGQLSALRDSGTSLALVLLSDGSVGSAT